MPEKLKICLLGRHSHRLIFSYPAYKILFDAEFVYTNQIDKADIILFGFVIDINEYEDEILRAIKKNPDISLIVLSEEPLWDTLWSPFFKKKKGQRYSKWRRNPLLEFESLYI